jgi:lipopolysaccharide transport system permease protein
VKGWSGSALPRGPRSDRNEVSFLDVKQPDLDVSALAEVVYTPDSPTRHPGQLLRAMARDLVAARGLAWRLFRRDLSAMYRQSLLGYLWAFAPPLLAGLPWIFLRDQNIVVFDNTGIPYTAFVMTGTVLWQLFLDALNSPLKQTSAARAMLAKINFPREALLLAGLAETLWNLVIRLVVLIAVLWMTGIAPTPSIALAPVGLAVLLMLGFAIGLFLTPAGLLYGDVGRVIAVMAGFGMLLTPVVYPPPARGLGRIVADWNPLSPVLVMTRGWITGHPSGDGTFTDHDIRDASSFVRMLKDSTTPLSRHISGHWSPETSTEADTVLAGAGDETRLRSLLVADLNRLVSSGPLVAVHHHAGEPDGATRALPPQTADARLRLWNGRLLRGAYPHHLARGQVDRHFRGFCWVAAGSVGLLCFGWLAYRLTMPVLIERMGS